jgi:hypothetical protein
MESNFNKFLVDPILLVNKNNLLPKYMMTWKIYNSMSEKVSYKLYVSKYNELPPLVDNKLT